MYKILFPSEPFNKKNVDSSYLEEFNICKLVGISTYLFDYDEFIENGKLLSNINYEDSCIVIYRGWMMKPEQYEIFYFKILDKSNGKIRLINTLSEYRNCHCFPNVYTYLKDYTPKMVMIDNHNAVTEYKTVLRTIDFDFFIKDHVKSIKTDKGVEKINKNITCLDLLNKVTDFVNERGNLFTGGIVLKEFVNLKKYNDKTNEWRFFFLTGQLLDSMQNSNLKTDICPNLNYVFEVYSKISHTSNFFTIDFAELVDGSWIVIETGDGQVSGFPSDFKSISFYNKLKQISL